MPKGSDAVIEGVAVRCYNIEEYRSVAHAYIDANGLHNSRLLLLEKIEYLELSNDKLKQLSIISDEKTNLMKLYVGNTKKELMLQKVKLILPWTLAVIEAAAILVLVLPINANK